MMKAVTYMLAAICVVVSIMWLTDGPSSSAVETVREGESLTLLYELSDAELASLTGDEVLANKVMEEVVSEAEENAVVETEIDIEPEAAAEESPVETAAEESPAETLVAEGVPSVEAALAKEAALAQEAALSEVSENEIESEPVCYEVGEVRDPTVAVDLGVELERSGYDVVRSVRFVEELGPYMVHTESLASPAAASALVEALRKDGLESIMIREPPYQNGVSLGVFQSDENSASLVAHAKKLGYDVQRRRLPEEVELIKFFLSNPQAKAIADSFWQKIRSEFPEIQIEEKSC